mmetsp:Transcript_46685/g.47153  ORF Transcript_46685/g.47153 Transcript_46685/m.47153 type:complete len:97 (-) Transcript_46685:113-403(-)
MKWKSLVWTLIAWHRYCVQKRQKMDEISYVGSRLERFNTRNADLCVTIRYSERKSNIQEEVFGNLAQCMWRMKTCYLHARNWGCSYSRMIICHMKL